MGSRGGARDGSGPAQNIKETRISRRALGSLQEDDEVSASVDIDDIIGSYDLPSLRSTSTSIHSFLSSVRQLSQTYFSANSTNYRASDQNDDTTSFHSALQDGFSLSQYDLSYGGPRARRSQSGDFTWCNTDPIERELMLKNSDFELLWHNIDFKIPQKLTFEVLFGALEESLSRKTRWLRNTLLRRQNQDYEVNSHVVTNLYDRSPISILQNVDGTFKSSHLTAIIGPSGAGKTSLLNFLARRREAGYMGEYHIHGTEKRVKISTIPQDDRLPSYLSVRENLTFASRMKNSNGDCDHQALIERVAVLLGLVECLETRTGKISGGQCKRLAIAQELLSIPDVLILDEPTSGLDSSSCYKTVSALKDLVRASARKTIDPMAIVITIHQPEQEVFDLFDKIYVMAMGGRVIYDGTPDDCLDFVKKHTGISMPTIDYNPSSFLIEIASGEYGEESIRVLSEKVRQAFQQTSSSKMQKKKQHLVKGLSLNPIGGLKKEQSESADNHNQLVDEFQENSSDDQYLHIDNLIPKGSSTHRGHFWPKTCHLLKRSALSIGRDPKQLFGSILFHILLPVFIWLISGTMPGRFNACPNIKSELRLSDIVKGQNLINDNVQEEFILTVENVSQNFVIVFALCSSNIAFAALSFAMDMQTSLKEFHNGWYSMSSYLLSRVLVTLPLEIILPFITITLYWYLTGQAGGGDLTTESRLALAASGAVLGTMIGQTIGMIFGTIYMKHITTALFLSQAVCLPLCFFSGFVVRTKTMSTAVLTLSYASFYRHVMAISVLARYGFNMCECNPKSPTTDSIIIVGVPDRLKSFGEFFFNQVGDSSGGSSSSGNSNSTDIFQTFAKQISLYNSYGIEIHSCSDVRPYQLYEYSLEDKDMLKLFISLLTILIIMKLLMYATVRYALKHKTSL